jgi:hypothetical protein
MRQIKITDLDNDAEFIVFSDGSDAEISELLDSLNSAGCFVAGEVE